MRVSFLKIVLLFILMLGLESCLKLQNISDSTELDKVEGIIVFRATYKGPWGDTIHILPYDYSKLKFILSGGAPYRGYMLKQGTFLYVYSLPKGEYMWSGMGVGMSPTYRFPNTNRFTIEPEKINYVGDITIEDSKEGLQIKVENNKPSVLEELEKNYKTFLNKYPVVDNHLKINYQK